MQSSQEGVRRRLEQAALELFQERGYDRTTATEIAAKVGLTERTFFRYFADKRETLFGGEAALRPALTEAVRDAPVGLRPLEVLFHAFRSVAPLLEANRAFAAPRQKVIASTPALHERELTKHEALSDALAAALEARGVDSRSARLAARIGMAAFVDTTVAWLEDPEPSLATRLDLVLHDLGDLLPPSAPREAKGQTKVEPLG